MRCGGSISVITVLGMLTWCSVAAVAQSPEATPLTADAIRQTIDRSLPYLETAGVSWMNGKKCVSCHRVSFLTWSFNEAAGQGFEVDRQKIQGWVDWSVTKSLETREEGKPVDGELNVDGLTQFILGHPAGAPVALRADTMEEFVRLILKTQQEDGSWKPAGQLPLQKRPEAETAQVSTMWNVMALRASGSATMVDDACQQALNWLATSETGSSTEWYAVRLLLSDSEGDQEKNTAGIKQLRSIQNSDGGWGWLTVDSSDALATGLAVYALSVAGVAADDSVVQSAQRFLITTQSDDGSWKVRGTKDNKKSHVEETATYWGTAWATIALLRSLP